MRRFLLLALTACATASQSLPDSAPPSQPATSTPAPAAAATPAPVQDVPKPTTQALSADTPQATSAGVSFVAPAGWTVTSRAAETVLTPPEDDTHLAIVDVPEQGADAAVAAAWKVYKPEMQRPLRISNEVPAREGWEERRVYDYETSPNERAVVQALAMRAGQTWTVLLVDGKEPTLEKRAGPTRLVMTSLRPKGYARESFAGKTPNRLDAGRIALLRKFLEDGAKAADVPGVAFSLLDGGKVVYEGGIGVNELGKSQPVDANTLFLAASNTKGMVTLLLARLVDAGKLGWDQPVTQIYPAFKLGDADTTKQVLVKHLICACTGLPRQDLEWLFEYRNATPESTMRALGAMQPTSKFGEVFQYSNPLAAAAGFIGGHLVFPNLELGAAFDQAMRKEVFKPIGMNATTFDFKRVFAAKHASPHGWDVDGKTALAPMAMNESILPVRPAGGMWTTAHDLAQYVALELAEGKLPNGKQLVSQQNLDARRKPNVIIGEDNTYGMGLMVNSRWGVPVVHHGGDMIGYHSDMIWIPGTGIGATILTNSDSGVLLRGPFLRRILEVVYDGNPEAEGDLAAAIRNTKARIAKERERLVVPADAAEAAKLAPRYHSEALGDLAIEHDGDKLIFDAGEWRTEVASRRNDDGTISYFSITPGEDGFEWVVAERDGKRALVVRDGQHEYLFLESGTALR